jgi:hypothetical protein
VDGVVDVMVEALGGLARHRVILHHLEWTKLVEMAWSLETIT